MGAQNFEAAKGIAEVFCHTADALVPLLLQNITAETLTVLDLMLKLSNQPDREITQLTFYFWRLLSDEIHEIGQSEHEAKKQGNQALEQECAQKYQFAKQSIAPYYIQFITHLVQHITCDDEEEGVLSHDDDLSDFRERLYDDYYPQSLRGLMLDTAFIAGSTPCCEHFWAQMQAPGATWQVIEANIFMIMTALGNANEKCAVGMALLQFISTMGHDVQIHPQLRHTALQACAQIARWGCHTPEVVAPLFAFLMPHIGDKDWVRLTVKSISVLCNECGKHMAGHFQDLLKIVQHADQCGLKRDDCIRIVKSTSRVMSKLPIAGEGSVGAAMEMFCGPELQKLNAALQQNQSAAAELTLRMFVELYKNLNIVPNKLEEAQVLLRNSENPTDVKCGPTPHPCWAATQQVWAGIIATIQQFAADKAVVAKVTSLIKYIFRALTIHAEPLLQDAVGQMTTLYQAHQHSDCLYVAAVIVEVFGHREEYATGFYQMLESLSTPTFAALSVPDAIRHHPDHIQDYCRLGKEIIKKNPRMFLQTALGPPALQLGNEALATDHKDTLGSACEFMKPFLACWRIDFAEMADRTQTNPAESAELRQMVVQILAAHGQVLVHKMMLSLCGGLEAFHRPDICEVLHEIHIADPQSCAAWIQSALGYEPCFAHFCFVLIVALWCWCWFQTVLHKNGFSSRAQMFFFPRQPPTHHCRPVALVLQVARNSSQRTVHERAQNAVLPVFSAGHEQHRSVELLNADVRLHHNLLSRLVVFVRAVV